MVLRVAIALSAQTELKFYEHLLPTTRDQLQVVARIDSMLDVASQLRTAIEQCDVVLYDPAIDRGKGLALWSEYDTSSLLVCWCTQPEHETDILTSLATFVLNDESTSIDVDVALRRCRRALLARSTNTPMMARSPVASYHPEVVAFPHTRGIEVRSCESIVHVEGQGNYSMVVFKNEPNLLLSRTIGDFEDVLPDGDFLRVHRSHIVNLRHVRRVLPGRTARVLLDNGDEVSVSNRYRGILMRQLNIVRRK